jgi:excinuclease UvrABC ATPase subunit
MYRLKYNQNVCEHCEGFVADYVTFEDVLIPKTKKKTKTEVVPIMITVIETRTIQTPFFNSETNRWEIEEIEETKTFEKQEEEFVDIYDKSGNIIGRHRIEKTKTEEKDVIDLYTGNVVYEDVLDENGAPVQIQKYNKRYINESGNEITKEEYEIKGGAIVIDCPIQLICPKFKELCLS